MTQNNRRAEPADRNRSNKKRASGKINFKKLFNSLGAKKYLAAALLAIMLPLLLCFAIVHKKIPEKSVIVPTTQAPATTQASSTVISDEQLKQLNKDSTNKNSDNKSKDGENGEEQNDTVARRMAKIIEPTDEEYWYLSIIGVKYPLPEKYAPSLSPLIEGSSITVDERIVEKYRQMYDAAKKDDCILTPYSGYHSYSLQKSSYTRKVNFYINQGLAQEEAESKASLSVQPAGCSEHNAGLAVDIVSASEDFAKTKEYQWLSDHAQEYGFILRYPADKTKITGMDYEPWHWRYVGEEAAQKMKDKNECLEEYLGIV